MGNFTFASGTATIGATEFSLAQGAPYSPASPRTTQGYVQVVIDFGGLAAGDQYQVRIYERAGGGPQKPLRTAVVTGAQAELTVTPLLLLGEGWDVTLKKLAGADRAIAWSVRQDTNDVNAATIGAGAIGAPQLAAGAITAATFAHDAIDASAVAAGAVAELQAGLATAGAVAGVQADTTSLLGRLTASRAAALDNVDAAISSRAPAATALSTAQWTGARATALDQLDADVSSRAAAATAVSSLDYTAARAAKLDQLDAATSTRAPAGTALSTAEWTGARAVALDNLDAPVSSRASSATAAAATAALQAAVDDLRARIPVALDPDGNLRAGVASLTDAARSAIADAIFDFELEAAPAKATTFLQRVRILWSILAARATGLTIPSAGIERFRDGADTKDRVTYTLSLDGTRSPSGFDGT